MWPQLLVAARRRAGLSQDALAREAATSRSALSAYEHARKAPTADTLERLLRAAGARLDAVPVISWREVPAGGPRTGWVPSALWRLPVELALADVVLPLELDWSTPGRVYELRDRRQRARLYEVVLREGVPGDIERYVDGALLLDAWADLVLPRPLRSGWQSVIDATNAAAGGNSRTSDRRRVS